jgi:transcriptional regulator with XRE-family HTH domain
VGSARNKKPTFGQAVIALRREQGLNQRELAARIQREDGAGTISPQYLSDIEHDRRSPSSDHMMEEIARALQADTAFLSFLAGQLPAELRDIQLDPMRLRAAIAAFQKAARVRP